MKKISYKVVLVIWLAIGISVSGYFNIYPNKKKHTEFFGMDRGYYSVYDQRDLSILITLVGALLIGGLGYLSQKQN